MISLASRKYNYASVDCGGQFGTLGRVHVQAIAVKVLGIRSGREKEKRRPLVRARVCVCVGCVQGGLMME